jgi:hypothetical protein
MLHFLSDQSGTRLRILCNQNDKQHLTSKAFLRERVVSRILIAQENNKI